MRRSALSPRNELVDSAANETSRLIAEQRLRLTVGRDDYASRVHRHDRVGNEIERRVAEAAKLLRLEPFLKRTPLQLSGGQQQRTAIARALVKRQNVGTWRPFGGKCISMNSSLQEQTQTTVEDRYEALF